MRTLDKVMRFMTDHTDQEFPPGEGLLDIDDKQKAT